MLLNTAGLKFHHKIISQNGKLWYTLIVRVISVKRLMDFWTKSAYRDSEQSLRAWYAEAKKGHWSSPHEIKRVYGTASLIGNERIVFNICGNKYRLVVAVKYEFRIFYVRFLGTHRQYDQIDAKEV